MEYVGEHLVIGQVGNIAVILSFIFALLSSISYFFASGDSIEASSWKSIARISFRLHSLSVIGIVVTLFTMLMNHYFEYEYVWHHSNKAMPMRYIFSCFWEGQEGSFLLWTFWHVVLGLVLQFTAKDWEAPVMTTVSLVQAFLASMLLGVFIFEHRIGSNPFTVLLREHPDFSNIPLFGSPNYLEKLDGRGLNPLLQNYWMTIHPPTLFLGFASTLIPFAFAIAGLWKKKYTEWITPALPWAFFGVMILGVGVLMGGAWAYEALSFGGFWAWDPVENASLVPWLTLVGAAHLMLVNKNKANSVVATFFFAIITFILILYSTFLTRSGILGESSVHAFTDLGMSGQLLIYLLFFLFLGIGLILVNWNKIPKQEKEEELWSREFWLFVGAVVLLISSFQIIFYTSVPVWNKLFDLNMAPAKDVVEFYNMWQLPFAFIIGLLIAISQYFNYKNTDISVFKKRIALSFIVSLLLTLVASYFLEYINYPLYGLLLFSNVFAVIANADYFIRVMRGKVTKSGASLAHLGFGLMMIGILISTSKKEIISKNTSGKNIESLGETFSNNVNILLTKGDTLAMGDYFVTYVEKRHEGINVYFDVDYFKKSDAGNYEKEFTLSPRVQTNPRMGNIAEPDTRHFVTYDVYTHVTYADLTQMTEKDDNSDYRPMKAMEMKLSDTVYASNALVILDSITSNYDNTKDPSKSMDIAIKAHLRILSVSEQYTAEPIYVIKGSRVEKTTAEIDKLGLKFIFSKVNPEANTIEIGIQEKKENVKEFIVMQAMIFPYINVLWLGCIVMALGTLIAIIERVRRIKQ